MDTSRGISPFFRDCSVTPVPFGNPVLSLITRLKCLKTRLREWNRDVFHNIFNEIQLASMDLDAIQREIDGDTDELFEHEMNQTVKINGLLVQRQAYLSQKNHLLWLQDGDRNSAFFHRLHSASKSWASINTV